MRRAIAISSGLAASVLFVLGGGCSLLVSFDDVPSRDAGAALRDTSVSTPVETGSSTTPDAGVTPPDPAKCDLTFDRSTITGCGGFEENAQICADNSGIRGYPGSTADRAKDVVTCSKTKGVICVEHCTTKCAHLPAGFPDQCDQCTEKADGHYCGIQMGWPTSNFALLVRCTGNHMVEGAAPNGPVKCAKGCDPSPGGAASCL